VDLVAKVPNSNRTKNGDTNRAVRQAAIVDVYQELHTSLAVGEHPNLVQPWGISCLQNGYPAVMYSRASGDVSSVRELVFVFTAAAAGITFMHSRNYVDADVKPDNILIFKNEEGEVSAAKVADMGLSMLLSRGKVTYPRKIFGTSFYTPPEFTESRLITFGYDVYSFGVTILMLLRVNWRTVSMVRDWEAGRKELQMTEGGLLHILLEQACCGLAANGCVVESKQGTVKALINLAVSCMLRSEGDRIVMNEVVDSLEKWL
jgi:hypothetical protein